MVLSLVALPISGRQYNGLSSLKVARFATVCLEWQISFETCTFRRLVLDPDCLGEFDAIVRRHDTRLGYIRKLWLWARLSKYECPDYDEPEDAATQHCNNMIFTTCVQYLLGTLKLQDPARHGAERLALRLSASSPSDTEHRFNRCEIKDSYPFHYAEDLDLALGIVDFHRTNITDPFSRHFHTGYPPPLYNEYIKRAQGTSLRLEPRRDERGRFISHYKSLPAIPMIKGLVMHRQFLRDIHVGTLSRLLGQSFGALEWFRFERTVSPELNQQTSFDKGTKLGPDFTLSFPRLEVIELWGTCADGQESHAYIFRYIYEDGRASIVWRSCEETMVAQARIIAKWSEVAQRHSHSTLTYNVAPIVETKAEISKSDGTCIYRNLLLKDLVFDPITQIILENEPNEWNLDEKSGLWEQSDPMNLNFANPDSLCGDPLIDIPELDDDLASLHADLMAIDAEVSAFLQQHYG